MCVSTSFAVSRFRPFVGGKRRRTVPILSMAPREAFIRLIYIRSTIRRCVLKVAERTPRKNRCEVPSPGAVKANLALARSYSQWPCFTRERASSIGKSRARKPMHPTPAPLKGRNGRGVYSNPRLLVGGLWGVFFLFACLRTPPHPLSSQRKRRRVEHSQPRMPHAYAWHSG